MTNELIYRPWRCDMERCDYKVPGGHFVEALRHWLDAHPDQTQPYQFGHGFLNDRERAAGLTTTGPL